MSTYLLTWNPENWEWHAYARDVRQVKAGKPVKKHWTCLTKAVRAGDRLFLLRQGPDEPGIVGAGRALAAPDTDDDKRRVHVAFDQLVPLDRRIDRTVLMRPPFDVAAAEWKTRFSGRRLDDSVASLLESEWANVVQRKKPTASASPSCAEDLVEDAGLDDIESAFEGAARKQFIAHRQRERALRERKLREAKQKHHGRLICEVPRCSFDFEAMYGALGADYAHVHHLDPLASGPRSTTMDRLAVVCANCHAMVHREGMCRALDTLIPSQNRVQAVQKPVGL